MDAPKSKWEENDGEHEDDNGLREELHKRLKKEKAKFEKKQHHHHSSKKHKKEKTKSAEYEETDGGVDEVNKKQHRRHTEQTYSPATKRCREGSSSEAGRKYSAKTGEPCATVSGDRDTNDGWDDWACSSHRRPSEIHPRHGDERRRNFWGAGEDRSQFVNCALLHEVLDYILYQKFSKFGQHDDRHVRQYVADGSCSSPHGRRRHVEGERDYGRSHDDERWRRGRNDDDERGRRRPGRGRFGAPPWERLSQREIDEIQTRRTKGESPIEPGQPSYLNATVIKHAKEVDKRRAIWQRGRQLEANKNSSSFNVLPSALTACADDEKSGLKLLKLMGLKNIEAASASSSGDLAAVENESTSAAGDNSADSKLSNKEHELARQRALVDGLDRQYEIARLMTHRMKGKGLGLLSRYEELNRAAAQRQQQL